MSFTPTTSTSQVTTEWIFSTQMTIISSDSLALDFFPSPRKKYCYITMHPHDSWIPQQSQDSPQLVLTGPLMIEETEAVVLGGMVYEFV